MGEINFDFDIAGQALRQTEEITERINKEIMPGFRDIMHQLDQSWNTESGKRFLKTAQRETDKLEETGQLSAYAAACLKEAVLTAKRTEEQIKEIAESRTY